MNWVICRYAAAAIFCEEKSDTLKCILVNKTVSDKLERMLLIAKFEV
jgi:hypothetical protein